MTITCPPLKTASRTIAIVGITLGVALSPLATTLFLPTAHAQEEVTTKNQLTAIPPILGENNTLTLKPGEKTQATLRVENNSNETLTITSRAEDFIVVDGETPIPVPENQETSNRWSLASWMTIAPNEQVVAPGEIVGVNVLIEAPLDALPGGHYAMILHSPRVAGQNNRRVNATTGTSSSSISQNVGTLVYLVVEGPINYEAFTREFSVPGFTEYGPIPFSFTIDNRSDVHIRPQANIEISDFLGRTIESIPVEQKNVFPFTSRLFEAEWPQIWGWGYYTAKLTVSYGDQGQLITDTVGFWFFPIKIVIATLIGLMTLIAAGISIRRHVLHRGSDEQKRIALLEEKLRTMEQEKLRKYEDTQP